MHQPQQNAPTPHGSILFSPHTELIMNTAPNFSPAMTNPQLTVSIALSSPSSGNHRSPTSTENSRSSLYTKSMKDIPLLTGRHNWGPWHTATWTLIDCSNLLGHIHKNMLPGTLYDLDLEPSFPPIITCDLPQHEKDAHLDWWNHDKIAAYILTSHLFPHVLGTISIVNSQLGQCRSARMIYATLKNNYGAGDYSVVMAIEACL